jgi:hypothetical protein
MNSNNIKDGLCTDLLSEPQIVHLLKFGCLDHWMWATPCQAKWLEAKNMGSEGGDIAILERGTDPPVDAYFARLQPYEVTPILSS